MSYSLPKGRNYSKENLVQKKYYGVRHSEKTPFFSLLSTGNVLQQRLNNRTLMRRQSEDVLAKRNVSNQALKPIGGTVNYDGKYCNLNKKIRDILDANNNNGSDQINFQNRQQNRPPTIQQQDINMTKSTFIRRNQSTTKQSMNNVSTIMSKEKDSQTNNSNNFNLYFLECLKRKNSVTTQFYINIHTSILTFKQFYKLAHQCKPRAVDTAIPLENTNRKTIVFDMDETLIHTSQIMTPGFEIKVPFKAFQGKISNGYVNVRPYAKQILKRLSKHFDIIVFTAGNKCYADPILDHIDPTGVIQHRLYRESCTFVANQLFVKDLRILGRRLQKVVLVDNAPHSYMMQMSNGIPILNYFKGKQDNQLYHLQKYLMSLHEVQDVRVINSQYFRLHQYMKFDSHDKLISFLYAKKINGG